MKKSKLQEERFVEYLDSYKKLISKVARAYCNDAEERKDLIQDIIVQLWKSYPKYNPKWSISTWTYRIAINVSISFLRKATTRKHTQSGYQEDLESIPFEESQKDENLDRLYKFIELLKPIDKAIIILQLEGCKNKEIAEVMGMSMTNVATKKQRIKEKLKTYFKTKKTV